MSAMDMRAGGSALAGTPDNQDTEAGSKTNHLRDELEAARRRAIVTNARLALALRDSAMDPRELAKAADDATLAAGRVVGLAGLLCRTAPALLLMLA